MKNIFAFLALVLFLSTAHADVLPPADNYLMVTSPQDSMNGSFIFQKTKKIFYGFDRAKQNGDSYKSDGKRIKALFDFAEKINLTSLKSVDLSKVGIDSLSRYRIIEYKKDGKVYRVCWNEDGTDKESLDLNELLDKMNSFW